MLWLDFETRSRCDLFAKGVYNYAMDGSTEVLCMSYAFNDEEVQTWTPDQPFPERVKTFRGRIAAHNAAFERLIFWYVLEMDFRLEQFYCTAAQARANCLPGSLEDVGRALSSKMRKDYRGSQLIRLLSVPHDKHGGFNEDPKLMQEMIAYCEQDVRAMRAISKAMRPLSDQELADYHVNERINDRGVLLDKPLAVAATKYASVELEDIQTLVAEVTEGELLTVRSPKTCAWVYERVGPVAQKLMENWKDGEKKRSLDKSVRANLLILAEENPDEVPAAVADVIQCADDLWASSVAKFKRLAELADDEDNRVRGAFVFAGGSATGRASSYGAQVHNFARKCAEHPDDVRQAMVRGHEIVPKYGKRITDVLKGMLRPALIPAKEKKLVVADWASIEARVNPWASNCASGERKLELFVNGEDVYKVNASATFNVPVAEVNKDQRQIGKVQELACLSEDTLVLTACGEKPIQFVTPEDLVWDGVAWVKTGGAIYKGEKHVIEYDGLCATPDHLVWVEGQANPIEFGHAASNGLHLTRPRTPHKTALSSIGETVDGGETAVRKSKQQRLQNLWGARHYVQFWLRYVGIRLGFRSHGTAPRGNGIGSSGQHKAISGGKLALVHQSAKQAAYFENSQHSGISQVSGAIPSRSVCGQHSEKFVVDGFDVCTNRTTVEPTQLQAKRRVWDLLDCGPLHRFTASGRLVHNCGFAGGIGAFASMGRIYGVLLHESDSRRMVDAWRRANPWAVRYWGDLEAAYTRALRNKNHEFTAGRVTYLFDGRHLWYALPSGRVLCYPFARLEKDGVSYVKASWKPSGDALEWPRARLWKGLACENITQAIANDVLRSALRQLDNVVLHVHDEIVLESDHPEQDAERLLNIMRTPPDWAAGLPLDAEVSIMSRYGK
jgi:DNA polymerase